MATVNVGVLLKYGQPQGVLQHTGTLIQVDCTSAATTTAVSKVKLARKAQSDDQMEVDHNEYRWSSDVEALHTKSLSTIQVSPVLSGTAASLKPLLTFKMPNQGHIFHVFTINLILCPSPVSLQSVLSFLLPLSHC